MKIKRIELEYWWRSAQYYSSYWAGWPQGNSAPLALSQNIHNIFKNHPHLISKLTSVTFPRDYLTLCIDWMLSQRVCQVWDFSPSKGFCEEGRMRLFPWWPFFLRVSADFKDFATTGDFSTYKTKQKMPPETNVALKAIVAGWVGWEWNWMLGNLWAGLC